MNLLQEFKDDAQALAILRDWLGGGGEPVTPALAQERADICWDCPQNSPVHTSQLKLNVARLIKQGLQIKQQVNLRTARDPDLHVCKTCRCVLSLKVWVPIRHIRAHTTDDQLTKFPAHCWIPKETLCQIFQNHPKS
jgi:hypothetical protein